MYDKMWEEGRIQLSNNVFLGLLTSDPIMRFHFLILICYIVALLSLCSAKW